jgi:hypothetical protein
LAVINENFEIMRKIILLTILLIIGRELFSQNQEDIIDARPINNFNLNLLGDASIISINYERQFIVSPIFILSSKLGLGYNEEFQLCIFGPCSSPPEKYLTMPHHITGNFGKGRHFFEFGLGGTIINGNTTQPYLLYPIVGYRIMPLRSDKLNFRMFGLIPFSGLETDDILFIPFGYSFGISF